MKKQIMVYVLLCMAVMSQAMEKSEKCFVLVDVPDKQTLRQLLLSGDKSGKFFEWLDRESKKRQQGNYVDLLQVHFDDCIQGLSVGQKERAKQKSAEIIAYLQYRKYRNLTGNPFRKIGRRLTI
jgi:hypothetical protein